MDKEEVKKLANLARLEVSDEELESLSSDLNNILKFVNEIESADVSSVSKTVTKKKNVMREDNLDDTLDQKNNWKEKILKSAPSEENGYIKVKKIL